MPAGRLPAMYKSQLFDAGLSQTVSADVPDINVGNTATQNPERGAP